VRGCCAQRPADVPVWLFAHPASAGRLALFLLRRQRWREQVNPWVLFLPGAVWLPPPPVCAPDAWLLFRLLLLPNALCEIQADGASDPTFLVLPDVDECCLSPRDNVAPRG